MPLEQGRSKEAISHNIATEMHHGKPQNQAIAIAMRTAGVPKPHHDNEPNEHLLAQIGRHELAEHRMEHEAMDNAPFEANNPLPQVNAPEAGSGAVPDGSEHPFEAKAPGAAAQHTMDFGYSDGSPVGSQAGGGYMPVKCDTLEYANRVHQMWGVNEHDPENANGIVTPQ